MAPTTLDTYAPFDSGAGANVTEATWRNFMRHMLGSASGVIRGFTNEFLVDTAGSGMTIRVGTGECWMRGHYGANASQKTLAITTAHATLARKDRVIIRADFTNNRVEIDVLAGTAAASPVAPAVTQTTTIWETSLAIVDIPAADTVITSGQLTDDRVYTTAHTRYTQGASPISVATNSFTKITWTAQNYRTGDVTNNPAGTDVTLVRAGLWSITARAVFAANASGGRQVLVARSSDITQEYATQGCGTTAAMNIPVTASTTDRFAAGETISAWVWQNSGGNLDLVAGYAFMSLAWIGP